MSCHIFNATEYGEDVEFDVLTVGLSMDSGEYVLFQQGLTTEAGSNEPPYFEYKDQLYSGYGLVTECVINNNTLNITLSKPLNGHNHLTINLTGIGDDIQMLNLKLGQVFENYKDVLSIENT